MYYKISYITRNQKKHCAITSEQAYKLYKSWWLVMNLKKNDAMYAERMRLRKLFEKLGVVFVLSHKSYFSKFNKKYRTTLSHLTAKTYDENRLLPLPPLSMCKKTSISAITKILKQDIDAKKYYGPHLPESLKPIYAIPLKNGSLKKILQSGKSYMRRKILSPKVHAFRIQIMCDPKLRSDCIILPRTFAKYLQVYEYKLVEPDKYKFYNSDDFIELHPDLALILKRDPVLHAASIMYGKYIAFSKHDVMFVSSQIMEVMHADIDGDAFILYLIRSALAVCELKLFLNQQENIALPNQTTRLNCCNSHILYMYKRSLPLNHRYYRLYEFVRQCVRDTYLSNAEYMKSFEKLQIIHPYLTTNDIDPSAKILKHFFYLLCLLHGDSEAYEMINELNVLIYELSIGKKNALHQKNLPMCYFFTQSLLCKNLMATVLSEAKGTIDHYLLMLERKYKVDQTYNFKQRDQSVIDKELDEKIVLKMDDFMKIIMQMAVSSELVPRHGYETYKNSNDWSSLQVIGGKMYYRGLCMGPVEYFFSSPFMFPPDFVRYCLEFQEKES